MNKFILVYHYNADEMEFGQMFFNGKFVFKLNNDIDLDLWHRVGIIPVDNDTRIMESDDLFSYINPRLPIDLRGSSKEEKIGYIKKTGLRVPSDKFYFKSVV